MGKTISIFNQPLLMLFSPHPSLHEWPGNSLQHILGVINDESGYNGLITYLMCIYYRKPCGHELADMVEKCRFRHGWVTKSRGWYWTNNQSNARL